MEMGNNALESGGKIILYKSNKDLMSYVCVIGLWRKQNLTVMNQDVLARRYL
jgi:hypothetical protein